MSKLFKVLLPAVLGIVLLSSCSSLRYTSRVGGLTYNKDLPVLIVPFHDPSTNGERELVNQLLRHGFDVISVDHRYHSHKGGHRDYNGKNAYILDIKCSSEPGSRNIYDSFYATLTDGTSGRMICTFDLTRPQRAKKTMRQLVRRMDRLIK